MRKGCMNNPLWVQYYENLKQRKKYEKDCKEMERQLKSIPSFFGRLEPTRATVLSIVKDENEV